MKNLRQWELDRDIAKALIIAADARLSRTDYADDQVWRLRLGEGESPALALQTKYGGRAGLVSLVPIWIHEGQSIYQAQTYYRAPVVTEFAPNWLTASAEIRKGLSLNAHYWVMESRACGGVFRLKNTANKDITLQLDLYGHVIVKSKEEAPTLLRRKGGGIGMQLGNFPKLQPVVLVDGAAVSEASATSPRLGVSLTIKAGKSKTVRWVHAGMPQASASFKLALAWLQQDWVPHFEAIDQAARHIPVIQTGDITRDATIAIAYTRLVQAVLKPTGALPAHTFVSKRTPEDGFAAHSPDNRTREWMGQDISHALLLAPALATIAPEAAAGIVRNYIATQQSDGFIDFRPGPAGQRTGLLAMPVLANLVRWIYEQTGDKDFISSTLPALVAFFERWFELDHDADGDNIPEWQHDRQTGYVAFPTFAPPRGWAQGADIRKFETPDLLAYLIREAEALVFLAGEIDDKRIPERMSKTIQSLTDNLASFWNGEFFSYRDRDTHQTGAAETLLEDAPGDVEHFIRVPVATPSRLIVRIVGGVSHKPNVTVHIHGTSPDGDTIHEKRQADDFLWQNRFGYTTTERVFASVDRVKCEGLSRVYRVTVHTPDTTRLEINNVLPYITDALDKKQRASLQQLLEDSARFLRHNGWTMTDASGENYDPTNAEGAGGAWMLWNTLLGEAFIRHGDASIVGDTLKTLLDTMTATIQAEGGFGQFYHADAEQALGDIDHLTGIVPLYLFQRAAGIFIPSHDRVWTGGPFAWGRSITVRQHGVYVRRTNKGIKIRFSSGHEVELKADAPWQLITDPNAENPTEIPAVTAPKKPAVTVPEAQPTNQTRDRVIIDVEIDES